MASCPSPPPVGRVIRDAAAVCALFAGMAEAAEERCGFAYLDPEWRLLGTRETPPGDTAHAAVPFRDVVADVLALGATAVVMAHNHPGGDPAPSAADLAVTRRLARALEAIDARLTDHLILAGTRHTSLRGIGLL